MEFRLRDFAHPLAILRLRRLLGESQRWDEERRQGFVLERLRELLEHAHRTTPFWRRRLDEAGLHPREVRSPDDLRALPVLAKDDVRAHLDELRSTEALRFAPREAHTSGSTGTALRFLLDQPTNVLEFATLWRQFNWAGYHFGDRFADLRGHLVRSPSGIERDRRLNSLNLSAFDFTRDKARAYAAALRAFRPVMVRGYPSSIALLAAWALEDGLELPSPRAVVTSSENLLERQRAVVERAFRAPVLDYYGQMERVAFAGQCPLGSYHLAVEYGVVEILDERDAPVEPGVEGRIVATGLHHRAMPLIRYDTRDRAVLSARSCACGRAGPIVERLLGRVEDLVLTPEGRHVGRLDAAFKYSSGIRLAQVVQETPDEIQVRIVPGPAYGPADEDRLRHELRLRLGPQIAIQLQLVEDLALDTSGKLKFVISKLDREDLKAVPGPAGRSGDGSR